MEVHPNRDRTRPYHTSVVSRAWLAMGSMSLLEQIDHSVAGRLEGTSASCRGGGVGGVGGLGGVRWWGGGGGAWAKSGGSDFSSPPRALNLLSHSHSLKKTKAELEVCTAFHMRKRVLISTML